MSDSPDIGANRIRTPGIDGDPVPVDAEVRVHDARAEGPDEDLDRSLRPPTLDDFVNQAQVTEQLAIFIEAAQGRGEPLDHVLLAGPPGLGKTSLAHIVAAEMGVPMVQTAGPALERKADVASFLTALEPGSVFFVDEIHRLGRAVEETLYPAMEDGELPVVLGQGAGARTVTLPLPPFTLVGATTRAGLLTTPLRDRFGVSHRLEHYSPEHLAQIVERSAQILEVEIDADGAHTIASRSRGTPRVANRLLKRVRDFAQVKGAGTIEAEVAAEALEMLEVDAGGLDRSDRALLDTVATKFGGGPVGLSTLAIAIGEEQDTIEDVLEPYLLQQGLLKRTPRGRVLTQRAYEHLGLPAPEGASEPLLGAQPLALSAMPFFICPNCGHREVSGERTAGFSARPKGCSKCGFGFVFELLDDYYPAPNAAFFVCDKQERVIDAGKGSFELTGLTDEDVIGRPVREVLGLDWIDQGDGDEAADANGDGVTDPIETSLEWGVRSLGKRVSVNAEGDLPARGGGRRLPRLRRRRRPAARPHPRGLRLGLSAALPLRPALRRRPGRRLGAGHRQQVDQARARPQGRRRTRLPGAADRPGRRGHRRGHRTLDRDHPRADRRARRLRAGGLAARRRPDHGQPARCHRRRPGDRAGGDHRPALLLRLGAEPDRPRAARSAAIPDRSRRKGPHEPAEKRWKDAGRRRRASRQQQLVSAGAYPDRLRRGAARLRTGAGRELRRLLGRQAALLPVRATTSRTT